MYFAGIDIGSTMTKVVIIEDSEKVVSQIINHTGAEHRRLANKVMEEALKQAGLSFDEISYVIATGYGRINVPFADRQVTELSCHARGVFKFLPTVRLAIDIGGQDSKALKIRDGKLVDFTMSDRCAAGTGRFLEVLAPTIGLSVDELADTDKRSTKKIKISSTCTVFGQQEVVSLLSDGEALEDIVAGLHDAIAIRVASMARKMKIEADVVFTGGVAKNAGVARALAEKLGCELFIPGEPLLSGALGAALLSKETVVKAMEKGEAFRRGEHRLEEVTFYDK